jgi:hypothetical protein
VPLDFHLDFDFHAVGLQFSLGLGRIPDLDFEFVLVDRYLDLHVDFDIRVAHTWSEYDPQ